MECNPIVGSVVGSHPCSLYAKEPPSPRNGIFNDNVVIAQRKRGEERRRGRNSYVMCVAPERQRTS